MNTYKYIINPKSGRRVLSTGKIGQRIIRNYISAFQSGGSGIMRSINAKKASISRKARSAVKKTRGAAGKASEAMKLKKDTMAWNAMSTERKCSFLAKLTEEKDEAGKTKCNVYNEAVAQKAAAKKATQQAELDVLTTQMNTHKTMANDLSAKMELNLAQDQMLKARLVAKEIALLTGEVYADPFGLGKKPSGNSIKVKRSEQTEVQQGGWY